MKVSELWLREWVNPTALNHQELAAKLTMAGLEVDAVSPVAGPFNAVIVAEVMSTKPHPQADRLTLCEVNTGSDQFLQVVCGASNVRAGLKVALAQIGACLPGDFRIKESKLRGELSQGMLCSLAELGMAESADGIMELHEDAPVGQSLRDYLQLDDTVLDIDLTPNRADCFSVLGIARELSVLTDTPLKTASTQVNQPSIDDELSVQLKASEACPKYCGRVIRGVNLQAKTPIWMNERLRRSGLRSINPVVDITNYVMLELGQPMHAFDLQALQGNLVVRFAKSNERLTLLDGEEIELNEQVLLIADSQKPLALAGIMGGEMSAVQDATQDVFLESAFFNPLAIAGVARRYGLCTDSSQRFERGVDPNLSLQALERATTLLLEIAGGEAGPTVCATEKNLLPEQKTILFNPEQVKRITGLSVTEEQMVTFLHGLGMQIEKNALPWKVKVPSHRFDLSLEVDLVEEIIRLYGYDNIKGEPINSTVQAGTLNSCDALAAQAGHFFAARGYHETISYSFVDPELQQALYPQIEALTLLNPISSELSQMRTGMWPGLLASLIYNLHRQQTSIKFFEQGVVFLPQNEGMQEYPCIAGLMAGEQGALHWSEKTKPYDFYDLKGDIEAFLSSLSLPQICFLPEQHPALHPGKSAVIQINQQEAGWCGVLHPRIAQALDLHQDVILFELRLDALLDKSALHYRPISKFPQIRRDLSFLVDSEITVWQIEEVVRQTVTPAWLKGFAVFDVYQGESIPAGKKSIAIALTLQDDSRTLIDQEINVVIDAIIKKLDEIFSIILRD